MKLVFVSNYINHHQIPVSENLFNLTGGEYVFIQTEPMEEERVQMGWNEDDSKRPYVKLYYENKDFCDKLIFESECVIFGGCENEEIIKPRLDANRFTIRYSERIYKEGRWKFVSPRGLVRKYKDHIRYRKNDVFMLCAGAFVKGDFDLIHAYPGKMLKYGYFPKEEHYDDVHFARRNNEKINILWAARFIDWKHPEMMIELARKLKESGVEAKIQLIGNGILLEDIKALSKEYGTEDIVSFVGNKTPEEVRKKMLEADLFVSTSDRKEGWGAVVNEAMNSGCVTIASDKIGAAPYLIKSGENGYIYKACSVNDLYKKVLEAVSDKEKAYKLGANAYATITEKWNAKVAAERLIEFINDKNRNISRYKDGPLSRA